MVVLQVRKSNLRTLVASSIGLVTAFLLQKSGKAEIDLNEPNGFAGNWVKCVEEFEGKLFLMRGGIRGRGRITKGL